MWTASRHGRALHEWFVLYRHVHTAFQGRNPPGKYVDTASRERRWPAASVAGLPRA